MLEQHLNGPFRPYGDGSLSQLVAQDAMAFMERAKQHLQMFGNNPNAVAAAAAYQESILPQLYQRHNLNNINLGLWQGFWPQQIPPNFLAGMPFFLYYALTKLMFDPTFSYIYST